MKSLLAVFFSIVFMNEAAALVYFYQIGNTTYGSDGSNYTRIGNTIHGSDGSSCSRYGSMTFCN